MTLKAGCYLINLKLKSIAIIYRDTRNDYSFPKGHLEKNETLEECAIRETAEEVKRIAKIVSKPYISKYITPSGEDVECYMYIAIDEGKSNNVSTDTHEFKWIPINEVMNILTYNSLKEDFKKVLPKINKIIENKSTF